MKKPEKMDKERHTGMKLLSIFGFYSVKDRLGTLLFLVY